MSFRWFIYYCALFGGCAAYVGWVLGRLPPVQHHVFQAAVKGLFLGLALAVGLTLVDAVWHLSGREGCAVVLRVIVAGLVGGVGGFMGGMIGQILYGLTQSGIFLVFGWTITGVLIGGAPGVYDLLMRLSRNEDALGAKRKVINGVLGGLLGGMLGGVMFLFVQGMWEKVFGSMAYHFWSPSAMGFVCLGLCIGLLIGLAQVILKTAWIVVVQGFRSGRELILSRGEVVIGRAEGCDIPLFGDPGVEKQHARILTQHGRYVLEDLDTPGGTFVNGQRLREPVELRAGDLIEVGRSALRFGERVKRG